MRAAAALKAARDAGIHIGIDGDDLVLEAPEEPSPAMFDLPSRDKAGILSLLGAPEGGWTVEHWQVFFNERAGVAEFEAGLLRPQAEARAFTCCITKWMNRNPVRSAPDRCVGCGDSDRPDDPLSPLADRSVVSDPTAGPTKRAGPNRAPAEVGYAACTGSCVPTRRLLMCIKRGYLPDTERGAIFGRARADEEGDIKGESRGTMHHEA